MSDPNTGGSVTQFRSLLRSFVLDPTLLLTRGLDAPRQIVLRRVAAHVAERANQKRSRGPAHALRRRRWARRLERKHDVVVESDELAGAFEQIAALWREERRSAAAPLEQRTAGQGLELLHLQRHRRLRAPDPRGRAGEASGLRERRKGAQEINVKVSAHDQ